VFLLEPIAFPPVDASRLTLYRGARQDRAMHFPRRSRDIIRRLKREGWTLAAIKGSHHTFKHPAYRHIITVPHPKDTVANGTVFNIAKLAGWRDNRSDRRE
jgi:predicted RNA binding protein YcfA (HicA-like mRNA interferase family)